MKYQNKFFFSSEDEQVVNFNVNTKKIDKSYKYISTNPITKLFSFISYSFTFVFVFIYYKLIKHVKFVNRKALKNFKNKGYFVYSNHTMQFGDAFCPALICFPKIPRFIVNADNVSIKFIGYLLKIWGALPLPDDLIAYKNFLTAIEHTINKNKPIIIYPEKNLWPYYTKIRQFKNSSFRYPIKYNCPVFCFTTTYHLKKLKHKPKIKIFIDGPFYFDKTMPEKQAQQNLRDKIFSVMQKRSNESNYEFVKYVRRNDD